MLIWYCVGVDCYVLCLLCVYLLILVMWVVVLLIMGGFCVNLLFWVGVVGGFVLSVGVMFSFGCIWFYCPGGSVLVGCLFGCYVAGIS